MNVSPCEAGMAVDRSTPALERPRANYHRKEEAPERVPGASRSAVGS